MDVDLIVSLQRYTFNCIACVFLLIIQGINDQIKSLLFSRSSTCSS